MTSLRVFACALLLTAACTKSAESHEVNNKPSGGATESKPAPETETPDREIKDTVAREAVEDTAGESGDEQAPEGDEAAGDDKDAPAAAVKGADKPADAKVTPAKAEIVALKSSTLADTAEYKLVLDVPDSAKSGKQGAVKVKLTPKKGWKLNKEFPTKLKVSPPSGVKLAKAKQGASDAIKFDEHGGAEWHVKFTSSSAGKKDFGGEFRFAVCTESTCDPKKEKLAFAVEVK